MRKKNRRWSSIFEKNTPIDRLSSGLSIDIIFRWKIKTFLDEKVFFLDGPIVLHVLLELGRKKNRRARIWPSTERKKIVISVFSESFFSWNIDLFLKTKSTKRSTIISSIPEKKEERKRPPGRGDRTVFVNKTKNRAQIRARHSIHFTKKLFAIEKRPDNREDSEL